ncbi:hypothetical protein EW145_g731 [Phellinidium pouzarii]|uniref:Uncharacterized protein n=1 Tax=Phellinidium pouzarii TaxID=167371 RepID=A0A4S4LHE1_9AGAM|nr:hypothetical protein EW145_g731 [Phellinidium pouzarii]
MSSESLRTPPRLINGRLLELRAVPDAGYGVYATEDIPAQTIVLTDPDPIIYAINGSEGFKTCSWCFRTTTKDSCDSFLERDGMSFCKDECMTSWKEKYEEEGLAAHAAVYEFIRSEEVCQLMDHDYKFETKCMLSEMEVEEIWSKAEEQAASIRSFRLSSEPNSDSTTLENGRQAREEAMRTPIPLQDPDDSVIVLVFNEHTSTINPPDGGSEPRHTRRSVYAA